ncbi:MAG: DUF1109 domain-containing protein [Burkholderiaceae bacterium]|nr:DUF1109 domain-containing protein [Burkholderiaceae bacterium]
MKTEALIHLLAADVQPVSSAAVGQRFAGAVLAGLTGAVLLLWAFFGLRPDLGATLATGMFWGKLGFAALLAVFGLALLLRLARPGMALGATPWLLPLPAVALWGLAAVVLLQAVPPERLPLVLGSTWRSCPFNIALLSAPAFAALFWALRGAAPTRLAWAGAGAGLLAGALGALVYALHCPEVAAPFLAVWYLAGMALPTALGALLGPRLLRW